MSTLFSSLNTSSAALQAFTNALGTEQMNVSNSATTGYAAVRASILPIGSSGPGDPGSDFVTISSTGNLQADAAVRSASSEASLSQTEASQLSSVNQLFDITGSSGILAAFQQFSTAFANVAVTPNDPALQSTALAAAGSAASAFNEVAASLDTQQTQINSSIASTVGQINDLASQIGQFNAQTLSQSQVDPATDTGLRNALDQLSSLVDITVTKNSDGTVNVLAGGQQPLVIESQSYKLSANPSAPSASQISSSGGGASPSSWSGQLGALLSAAGTITQLIGGNGSTGTVNILAQGFASQVNTLLSGGVTASGATGVPLFTYDTTNASNVARTLAVDPTVTAGQLALGTAGPPPQSNGVANQLSQLTGSSQPGDAINGQSPQDYFASIAAGIGQQLSDSQNQSTTDQTALTTAQTNRQQVSGVSLDQEAVAITALQNSYQASAKVISILDQLTSDTIQIIGGTL